MYSLPGVLSWWGWCNHRVDIITTAVCIPFQMYCLDGDGAAIVWISSLQQYVFPSRCTVLMGMVQPSCGYHHYSSMYSLPGVLSWWGWCSHHVDIITTAVCIPFQVYCRDGDGAAILWVSLLHQYVFHSRCTVLMGTVQPSRGYHYYSSMYSLPGVLSWRGRCSHHVDIITTSVCIPFQVYCLDGDGAAIMWISLLEQYVFPSRCTVLMGMVQPSCGYHYYSSMYSLLGVLSWWGRCSHHVNIITTAACIPFQVYCLNGDGAAIIWISLLQQYVFPSRCTVLMGTVQPSCEYHYYSSMYSLPGVLS